MDKRKITVSKGNVITPIQTNQVKNHDRIHLFDVTYFTVTTDIYQNYSETIIIARNKLFE